MIFAGIVARIPTGLVQGVKLIAAGRVNILAVILLLIIGLAITVATVAVELGQRKIPVQYQSVLWAAEHMEDRVPIFL